MRRIAILILFLAACSDPTDPGPEIDACPNVFACRTAMVDVQIVSLALQPTRFDNQTGLAIIHPDSVQVSFTVRNVGSDTAGAGIINLHLDEAGGGFAGFDTAIMEMPALAPGQEWRFNGRVSFQSVELPRVYDDRMYLEVIASSGDGDVDVDSNNNFAHTDVFHLAAPLLDIRFTFDSAVVTAGNSLRLNVVARNYGRHASAPAQTMAICLYQGFAGCTPQYRTVAGTVTIPAVGAGDAVQVSSTITIPSTAAWQDYTAQYSALLCAPPPNGIAYFTDGPSACAVGIAGIIVRPAYAVCAPPLLTPGTPATLGNYNCGIRPTLPGFETATAQFRFHIVAMDAQAGVTYTAERTDTLSPLRIYDGGGNGVTDLDIAPDRFRVASAGRVYLVQYSNAPALTIRVVSQGAAQ